MKDRVIEEVINEKLHAFGVILSTIGLLYLIYYSIFYGNKLSLLASFIYGLSLIILYFFSTLLHNKLSYKNHSKIYSILDYSAIYLLIAGTYTPFLLITLNNNLGFFFLWIVWGIAILGIIYQSFFIFKHRKLSLSTYLVMGWLVIFFIKPLSESLGLNGTLLLALGGVMYSLGSYFFVFDKKSRFNHAVWHVFVLLGSIFQYFSILLYVIPMKI